MNNRYDIWKCYTCNHTEIDERDIDIRCTFAGSREEPAEHEEASHRLFRKQS